MPKLLSPKREIISLLTPSVTLAILFACRPFWFKAWCATTPTPCTMESVNSFDRISFQYGSIFADFISNLIQNGVGAIAFILPFFLLKSLKKGWKILYGILLATLWNALTIEVVRAFIQRPRPLVYRNPLGDGDQIFQYTSFYSGHTSFVALATLSTFFWIKTQFPERKPYSYFALLAFFVLTGLTAMLRILGGRHFPTDVLGGCLFGCAFAYLFFKTKRFSSI